MNNTMMPDQTMARSLLRSVGLDVDENHIVPITGGTINHAFRIERGKDGPLILRISPSDVEAADGPGWMTSHGLRREQATIRLYEEIDHLLPRTVHFDDSRALIDRDWVLQTSITGKMWLEVRPGLTLEQEMGLWRDLGGIVRRMHSVVGKEFGPPAVGVGHATWSELVRWDVTGFLVDARRFELDITPFEELVALVDTAVPVLDQVEEPRLVHSDLDLRHVFLTRGSEGTFQVSGIIDMEFARFADPYSESVFVEQRLMPTDDGRDVALCEGYDCAALTNDSRLRMSIYELIATGWTVTDLMRRGQSGQVPKILDSMRSILDEARGMM